MVLESVRFPGQHVGVRESGEAKKPNHTGKGKHGQFTPIVKGTMCSTDTVSAVRIINQYFTLAIFFSLCVVVFLYYQMPLVMKMINYLAYSKRTPSSLGRN